MNMCTILCVQLGCQPLFLQDMQGQMACRKVQDHSEGYKEDVSDDIHGIWDSGGSGKGGWVGGAWTAGQMGVI